jgi:hypothetical protein
MDDQIEFLIKREFDPEVLNSSFYTNYPEFAAKLWSGNNGSKFAHSLGFPHNF